MMGNQKLFSTYKAYNRGNVIFGSNLRGNIIGKDTISNDYLKIDNVEHVDNLGFNLLSIGQICDNKCRVTFSEHDSSITKDGRVIGRGIRKKGLYVMKLGNKPKDQSCLATIVENSTLWHRLFKHVVSVSPELAFDRYLSHDRADRAMHPLAPHYERKTRADRGKKRPREPNASSSSPTPNHPSSSHPLVDPTDENDDESSHSNPSSPSQNISSSSNNVFRVYQNPPRERHY
ncbi:hypothetical protein Tco_0653975 [Tanacetum coccineum]|uniref:Retrovirus-related Pol polyprotein from transposon TNT 1-94-like beta-barrel domain-containing protein n=1 Tax=Tanacetum coccineum TaxID=301880 RepID=A0ABQ4X2V4_9ASTR